MFRAELSHDLGRISVLAIDGFIHCAHVVGSDFPGESMKSRADLWPAPKSVVANQRHSLIRRKIMAIILKGKKNAGPLVARVAVISKGVTAMGSLAFTARTR